MSLAVVGLNHRTGAVELRERLHFTAEATREGLGVLLRRIPGAGAVILSTCNRVEVYASHAGGPDALVAELKGFLAEWHGVDPAAIEGVLYAHTDRDAVEHLFRVACSLDSLVLGEGQILGQVHDAFLLAQSEQTTDKVLSALFQRAFSVAKKVRTDTQISAGKVSVGSVAVDLAVSIFMDLSDKTAMIVGSGKMGELALKNLLSRGVGKLLMVNRTLEKAVERASRYGGEPLSLDEIDKALPRADIVITSTGAPHYLLGPSHFEAALRQRGQAPMFVIDIAVPRNVDPAVNDVDNVYLYDVDDLKHVAEENREARRRELDHCMALVGEGVDQFWQWMRTLEAEPTIVSMSAELNLIRERELAKTLAAMPGLTEKQREEVDYLTKRIVNTILQRPMSQIKREMAHQDAHTVLHLVKRLFGLKETP